jgi:hypothetical protein
LKTSATTIVPTGLLVPTGLFWTAATIVIAVTMIAGCQQTQVATPPKRQIGTVTLAVEFGSAAQSVNVQIPCSEDSTVLDILQRAELAGELKLQSSGAGETAFVQSINGVGGTDTPDQYWTYLLNGKLAKTGSGVTEVDPGDEVQWRFGAAPAELTE